MDEYVIVGDTEQYKDCLIYLCGASLENAQSVLQQMLNNPTEYDEIKMKGHTNIRIAKVDAKNCWWNFGCD